MAGLPSSTPPAGFHGKLPSEGDFVSRRLPWEYLTGWDAWLQRGLEASRRTLGSRWQERYLNAPVWRFRLAGGVCGPQAWWGLFFPSIDRVGRYFPMTVAWRAEQGAPSLDAPADAWEVLEDAALVALVPSCTVEAYDRAVCALVAPPYAAAAGDAGDAVVLYTTGAPAVARGATRLDALPQADAFTRLLERA